MAKVNDNFALQGVSGKVGDIVLKTSKGKTTISKIPDRSKVVQSKNQTKSNKIFADAVAYAQKLMKDPEAKYKYKVKANHSLYQTLIKNYLNHFNPKKSAAAFLHKDLATALKSFSLSHLQLRAILYLEDQSKLTNKIYQQINDVSKATSTRHLKELNDLEIIKTNGGKGAGAYYLPGAWWENNRLKGPKLAE
jgi:DNA-binding transcriptional ArsR family regulator